MKNVKILSIGLGFILALSACGTASEKNTDSNAEEKHQEMEHKEDAVTDNQVLLNNGERWKVNPEMIPHLQAAEKRLIAYRDNSETDYKTLAMELKSYNDQLISSCTMQGESHDQLHLWLHPHIKLVKALSEAKNVEEADSIIAELKVSYEKYHKYFN